MTWGSNATYGPTKCRYCGKDDIDDRDEGDSSHELKCPSRPWWRRLFHSLKGVEMTWGPFLLTLLIGGLFGYAIAMGPTKGALICIALTVPLALLTGWLVDIANAVNG